MVALISKDPLLALEERGARNERFVGATVSFPSEVRGIRIKNSRINPQRKSISYPPPPFSPSIATPLSSHSRHAAEIYSRPRNQFHLTLITHISIWLDDLLAACGDIIVSARITDPQLESRRRIIIDTAWSRQVWWISLIEFLCATNGIIFDSFWRINDCGWMDFFPPG